MSKGSLSVLIEHRKCKGFISDRDSVLMKIPLIIEVLVSLNADAFLFLAVQ